MMQNPNIPEDWKQTIRGYVPKDEREAAEKAEILTLIDREGERLLTRDCAYAHVTASSVIVNRARTKTLMAFHKIYQSWAWTGGHADGETDLLHVAMREAREETGIERLRQIGNGAASLEILPVWAHVKRKVSRQLVESAEDMKRLALGALRSIQKLPELVKSFYRQPECRYILE